MHYLVERNKIPVEIRTVTVPELTEATIATLRPRAKIYRVADARCLSLEIHPNGAKYWRVRYRYQGRAQMLSAGTYPEVTVAEARHFRDWLQRVLKAGLNPSVEKRLEAAIRRDGTNPSFRSIAEEFLDRRMYRSAPNTQRKALRLLVVHAFPTLGNRPVSSIETSDILQIIRNLEDLGALDIAHRVRGKIAEVMAYAVETGRVRANPCRYLSMTTRRTQPTRQMRPESFQAMP